MNITSMTDEQKMSTIISIFRSFDKGCQYSLEDFYEQFLNKLKENGMSTTDFENSINLMINYFRER